MKEKNTNYIDIDLSCYVDFTLKQIFGKSNFNKAKKWRCESKVPLNKEIIQKLVHFLRWGG